ncbi:extracellular solute-binding protein [Hydrocarboniclastica marina]|uniref:ABC transporter substrate-binding protein n=1 Tax=Hydrocarboniclastica marina TaxID=2259620 RepID=A0A4P7XJX5_9ALTE|nr:extracellular solute-binding protein [Hydrocarboniclastica marina]QCF26187.1 ABC transporter substrate-binding protein [Hydrocarboniclastica marina]
MHIARNLLAVLSAFFILVPPVHAAAPEPRHGIAMHGELKHGPDFEHFDYVNPDAPKGGELKLAVTGNGFDTFNPFVLRGVAAAGANAYLYDTLLSQSEDEAFSAYGLIAEKVQVPEDRSWVTFHINPQATFHDGEPITADDVIFSFETLTEKGHPFYQAYYADVAEVKKLDDLTVRFNFKDTTNRELPLILGQLPVLPKHYWKDREFGGASLEPPVGSGPYEIDSYEAGRTVTYGRVDDYWAADLPVNRGRYNFDKIRYEYFSDDTVSMEAFKAGIYDFREETSAKSWATAYEGEKFTEGEFKKEEIHHEQPAGMQGFIYNTRRSVFQDPLVRQALAYAFDFDWTNRNLFYDQYSRTNSYFENSELASTGLPSGAELKLLEPHRKNLLPAVFEQEYRPPSSDEEGEMRKNLARAVQLLDQAGWGFKDGKMVNRKTGEQLKFEILLAQKTFERVVSPFINNLKRLGIDADMRRVDTTQYVQRIRNFDFDMFIMSIGQSNSPGNEQRSFWSSEAAEQPGSRNYAGVSDPVVDDLVDKVIQAPDREALVARTRALDRVLLWGHYVIPQWYLPYRRVAYTSELQRPETLPATGVSLDTWWYEQ